MPPPPFKTQRGLGLGFNYHEARSGSMPDRAVKQGVIASKKMPVGPTFVHVALGLLVPLSSDPSGRLTPRISVSARAGGIEAVARVARVFFDLEKVWTWKK